jgi:predicted secreted protein
LGHDLKEWAAAMARRVTGLMEPLRVIEVDTTRGEAILRSDSPTTRGERRTHYELKLRGGRRAALSRFAAELDSSARRQQVSFTLTRESLGKLIDDLTDTAA